MRRLDPSRLAADAGELLQQVVNRVAHGSSGRVLALMNDASVTLHQVMLLARVRDGCELPSELAAATNVSMAAVTQNVDRLVRAGLLARASEDPTDRRRRRFCVTRRAVVLLSRIEAARAAEYGEGLSRLDAPLLERLVLALRPVAEELQPAERGPRELEP